MNKTKIEWTDYTWNPVIGCKNGCFYCYAKAWAKRTGRDFKPTWSDNQYKKPYKIKEPSKIFVCSLADLFGKWVPDEWILKVLKVVKDNPQHTFQFLTKNPERYFDFDFPKNCWLGLTIDGTESNIVAQVKLSALEHQPNYKFISFEPLLGFVGHLGLSKIDLVIVGAMTGAGAIEPKKFWIDSIEHLNIFYKKNIRKYL